LPWMPAFAGMTTWVSSTQPRNGSVCELRQLPARKRSSQWMS
jgi:hypothetical protein